MPEDVADFVHYCRVVRRLPDMTCSPYEHNVTACMNFLQADGITDWQTVRPPDLRRFLAAEQFLRPAPSSEVRTVAALKCFFRFRLENEYLESDPAWCAGAVKRQWTA